MLRSDIPDETRVEHDPASALPATSASSCGEFRNTQPQRYDAVVIIGHRASS